MKISSFSIDRNSCFSKVDAETESQESLLHLLTLKNYLNQIIEVQDKFESDSPQNYYYLFLKTGKGGRWNSDEKYMSPSRLYIVLVAEPDLSILFSNP